MDTKLIVMYGGVGRGYFVCELPFVHPAWSLVEETRTVSGPYTTAGQAWAKVHELRRAAS